MSKHEMKWNDKHTEWNEEVMQLLLNELNRCVFIAVRATHFLCIWNVLHLFCQFVVSSNWSFQSYDMSERMMSSDACSMHARCKCPYIYRLWQWPHYAHFATILNYLNFKTLNSTWLHSRRWFCYSHCWHST